MFNSGKCTLKYRKYDKVFKNSTGTCKAYIDDRKNPKAYSYDHWLFLTKINGLVVFNAYSYSVSTSAHQSAVRSLISGKIKIDVIVSQHESLSRGVLLDDFYERKILAEIQLSRKGISAKSRADRLAIIKSCENEIAKLVKFQVAKKWTRKQVDELRTSLTAQENQRLENNRIERAKIKAKIDELKSEFDSLESVNLIETENEMNSLNEIKVG